MSARARSPLHRLQHQFMAAMTPGSRLHDTPGFRVFLWPEGDLFYRNVAVPVAVPADWDAAIARLREVFDRQRRIARLEFFQELWPELPAALERAGFAREMTAPAMMLTAPELTPEPARPPGAAVTFLTAAAPDALLEAFLALQATVFQELSAVTEPAELLRLRTALGRGESIAAMVLEDGEPVAAGSLLGIGAAAELAGVATRRDRRRRGLAERVCRRLVERFFAAGGELVWLSAGGAGSDGLYRKLGFRVVGTQLNYVLPTER
jgi:ribosomal protein S18 acetylase RimI-like enzyme